MKEQLYNYKAELIKVVDGDTVDLNISLGCGVFKKERVRLEGLNAPEIHTKDLREKAVGLDAMAFTERFLGDGFGKCYVKSSERGKYGRLLIELFVDGKSLNKSLIKEGHARIYNGGKRKAWFK